MANYNLVINSAFRPFSYAEMLAPIDAATKAHQALEDEYAALNTLASTLEKLAALESSSNAYKTYLKYKERLNALTDLLSKHGLNPLSRRTALDARADYASSIVPIQEALARRQALADELRKAMLNNPSIMFERDFRSINEKSAIDNLVGNDSYDYGRSMTGAQLMAMSKQASAGLAKDMFERGDLKLILPFQYERKDVKGVTGEDILAAINNEADKGNPQAIALLQGIRNLVYKASGMGDWENSEQLRNDAMGWIDLGLYDAIGGTSYEKYTDQYGMLNALAKEQGGKTKTEGEAEEGVVWRPVPKTSVDGDVNTKLLADDITLLKELKANPTLINKQSKKTVPGGKYISPDPQSSAVIFVPDGSTKEEAYYPYKEAMERLSKRYGKITYDVGSDGKLGNNNFDLVIEQADKDIRSSAVRNFSYLPNITDSSLISTVVKLNSISYFRRTNNTGLTKLKNNKKNGAVTKENFGEYLSDDSSFEYDVDLGFISNTPSSDGKSINSAVVDMELIDDPNRTFAATHLAILAALKEGEIEAANTLIDALMTAFDQRFNTLVTKQTMTGRR